MAVNIRTTKTRHPLTLKEIHKKVKNLETAGNLHNALNLLHACTQDFTYEGIPDIETLQIRTTILEKLGENFWADYTRNQISLLHGENAVDDAMLYSAQQAAIDNPKDPDSLFNLAETFIKYQHHVAGIIALTLSAEYSGVAVRSLPLFQKIAYQWRWVNMGSVCDLLSKKYPIIVSVGGHEDLSACVVLTELLLTSGREVHLLLSPMEEEIGQDSYDINAITSITIENVEHQDNLHIYRPIIIQNNSKILYNNSANVIEYINGEVGFTLLFCEKKYMDDYFSSSSLRLKGQCFTPDFAPGLTSVVAGYVGKYQTYIEHIYGDVTLSTFAEKGSVAISVVIPTRNNAYALEYTLKTCLNQRIKNYEIIVCDNSSQGSTGTRELIERLNDRKIRYIRPPRELSLTKNFEYAILHAQGEFIFTMGSDDGLPFHSLEFLESALSQLPDDDIIAWKRGFYVWPDLTAHGQNGQFTIPDGTQTKELKITRFKSDEIVDVVLHNPASMYALPMLYINSGFRRRYLNRLLNETGRLLDGKSQDLYMGIVNLAINPSFPVINSMLTFAGMCGMSQGVFSQAGNDDQLALHETDFIGWPIPTPTEEYIATTGLDVTNLIKSYLRVSAMGINPAFTVDRVPWEKIYTHCAMSISKTDDKYDLYIKRLTQSAYCRGNSFGRWFERKILPTAYKPFTENAPTGQKSFVTGFNDYGSLTLDAERFGVTNIYEACELFDKIYNL